MATKTYAKTVLPWLLLGPLTGPLAAGIVRNWRAGDRFWPVHSKGPKKIKELLQNLRVGGPERKLWPVVASRSEVIWVRGLPPSAKLQARGTESVMVRETPLQ